MKPPSEDHDLIRWLDGEMTDSEIAAFEARLKDDPLLSKEADELRALNSAIREHLPAEMQVPHSDFFNSQIQVRITQMDLDKSRRKESGNQSLAVTLLTWLRHPWSATAGAVAIAILGFVLMRPETESSGHSLILSSYTPGLGVEASTYHHIEADATVLILDGLEDVPADHKISGLSVHSSDNQSQFATTTLFDATGSPLLVVSRDAFGHPLFLTNTTRG
jgi:hypothetical protein